MSELGAILWKRFSEDDPRILLVESFQKGSFTYVKMVINDGTHDVTVQEIAKYLFGSPHSHKDDALKYAIQDALQKAANIITAQALAPVITEFSRDPV